MHKLVILGICLALTGCELLNSAPRRTISKTDVASARKGGPSAEVSISFFSAVLEDEANGKPAARAWGSYDDYWKSRMRHIATEESELYYDRVFRDFENARARLGLHAIVVPPYEYFDRTP